MSLTEVFPSEIPPETAQVVEPLLPDDSVYRVIADCASDFLSDADFQEWYAIEGRPGINPIILALVTIFQFLAKLPDRAAAHLAVMRLDWKYALRQPLDWTGFHYSDLCNFRKRLLVHSGESLIFERLLAYLHERGLVQASGRQRTDATHILGAVKQMSDVEVLREAVRLALGALVSADAKWLMRWIPASFTQNYSRALSNYRMSQQELAALIQQTGEEARWLLDQVACQAEVHLQRLPEVIQLARIWEEQYHDVNEAERNIAARQGDDKVAQRIRNPHDPDAVYGTKGRGTISWVGFKLHVTETIEEPRFFTDVTLTTASARDVGDLADSQSHLAERELVPAKHYLDQGYMSGENIAKSSDQGIDLRGSIGPDTQGKPPGFRLEDFHIEMNQQQALCPAGHHPQRWVPATGRTDNRVDIYVFFGKQCLACPFFGPDRCTTSQTGRKLSLNTFHDLIQARRQEERTVPFQQEMQARAAIEGTISELVRAHGLRRARYRGATKVFLQALFTTTAANLKRLATASAASFDIRDFVDHWCSTVLWTSAI